MRKRWALFLVISAICLLGDFEEQILQADSTAEIQEESAQPTYIALTFDDGPRQGTTDRLLDGLRERGASATFFLVGEQAALNVDLVKRMKEEGHQVGNHTWSHVRLEGADSIELLQNIRRNEIFLGNILGGAEYWLRPPYGVVSDTVAEEVQVPMIKWSVDSRDWESRNAEQIVQAVLKNVRPNSIVLLHDIYGTSVDAALELVDQLQNKGYLFVTVEELLRLNKISPKAGVLYRSGNQ